MPLQVVNRYPRVCVNYRIKEMRYFELFSFSTGKAEKKQCGISVNSSRGNTKEKKKIILKYTLMDPFFYLQFFFARPESHGSHDLVKVVS